MLIRIYGCSCTPDVLPGLSKVYSAVLEGKMAKSPTQGEITAKLRPDLSNRPRQVSEKLAVHHGCTFWD